MINNYQLGGGLIYLLYIVCKAKSTLPSAVSVTLFHYRNRETETGCVYRRCPTDPIEYNRVHWGFVAMSISLTEKVAQHVALFFPSKQRNYLTEAPTVVWT